ncbi:MAG: 6-carboxytetrahydropterin synthase [Gammaproteobacteria bacterium]|nr:6-carboxytetrahydropterin synthase [Gammaproteobacteria bacterium]
MKFSSGHYTIFGPNDREKLHGHNFTLYAAITTYANDNGIAFDYDIYKEKLRKLCKSLSGYFLLPGNSPYQTIEHTEDYVIVHFGKEKIPFPKQDVLILPLKNITVEELALWFIRELTADNTEIEGYQIERLLIKVFSAPGQCGTAEWTKTSSPSPESKS